MKKIEIGPHFFLVLLTCETMSIILDVLPKTDIHDLLRDVSRGQMDVLLHMVDGRQYEKQKIVALIHYLEKISEEFEQLKESSRSQPD